MYKAIFFDFFDVIHSDPYKIWLSRRGIPREGFYQELSDEYDLGKLTDFECRQRLGELHDLTADQITAEFEEINKIDPDVVALISNLKSNYKIGLISNCASSYIRTILDKHKLEPLFDSITISAEVEYMKPGEEIFKIALDSLNVNPEESIFIDDNPVNTDGARAIGMTALDFLEVNQCIEGLVNLGVTIN